MTKKTKECELCGDVHTKWWDCPRLVDKSPFRKDAVKHFNYSFSVKDGTPRG